MLPPSKQIRWLVDCDSFFASCELLLRPELVWRPVCIGWDIVIAATYDLKALGIRIGTPVWEVKKLVGEETVFLPPRISEYQKISTKLMDYLRSKAIGIQIFSIDEAFVEFTGYDKVFGMEYEKMMHLLKRDVLKEIGIPVSIGLAPTKLLAKMFAGINKPYGVYVWLDEQKRHQTLATMPIKKIPFIWSRTQERLEDLCETAMDFMRLPYEQVRQEMGKSWLKIWLELNGSHAMTFGRGGKNPKSIWRSRSFNPHFTCDKQVVWDRLLTNIERAVEELVHCELKTQSLSLWFRDKGFRRFGTKKRLPHPTQDRSELIKHCRELFEKMHFSPEILYRSTGVSFTELTPSAVFQNSLFATDAERKRVKLNKVWQKVKK